MSLCGKGLLGVSLCLFLLPDFGSSSQPHKRYDVVVYGATAGGVVAAIAAARNDMHVALVSVDGHLGGMVSGGLSATDVGDSTVIGGISREFFERVGAVYHELLEWNFEPHVAENVFRDMVRGAHVEVISGKRLREKDGVTMKGTLIRSLTLDDGETLDSAVFIDASYEGDLMAAAGVQYTWGRESTSEYGEPLAGVRGRQRPDHHFNVRVSAFGSDGELLPEIQPGIHGPLGQGDKYVQAYTFRMCLTDSKDDKVDFPMPPGYNPGRYEVLKRLIAAETAAKGRPPTMNELMMLSPIKGGKYDINSFGGFSIDHIGGSWGYPTASYQRQREIWQDHYNYEAGFFYFLAHDPSVPKSLQQEVNRFGLAKDEFVSNKNWPQQLYIREGRRMVGMYVMTQKDIQVELLKSDSIGMGSYESDSHHVRRLATADGAVENEGEMYVETHPYQIPYRIMLPEPPDASNLLVPVCVSASHVAYSTLRMEPQYMILGQAAGIAASISVERNVDVRNIPVTELQKRLIAGMAILAK